ncbi:MAG: mannitol-1-phosphate 5-dehydrogenase [Actinobacteria bacterium]|nr:mannitol-1-phosphate 5-dehydrogenase [Actinomycetota bacterium]
MDKHNLHQKKLVLFGAGNIGRSFIGQLFSRSGYEVVFVDIVVPIIEALNKKRSYNVIIKGDREEIINVKHVRGVLASDKEKVVEEVSNADIIASCVGDNALPHIIPLIAKGLVKRYERDKNLPLDIIIALNMRNAAEYFEKELSKIIGDDYPLNKVIGLVETSIGKMVPIMTKEDMEADILQIFAEPYNNLILDKKAFKNPIPDVKGLSPKDNMKAWVDRKLFIHNLGHAVITYLGHLYDRKFTYLYEALAVKKLYDQTRETMMQAAEILMKKYPGEFTIKDLEDHIDDLLERFMNKALGDTIYRVGRDLLRKLGPEDRLVGAIKMGLTHNMNVDNILYALVCGFYFRAVDESGDMFDRDIEFVEKYFKNGIEYILLNVCGFNSDKHRHISKKCRKYSEEIKALYKIKG